jgi:hypothetical protein
MISCVRHCLPYGSEKVTQMALLQVGKHAGCIGDSDDCSGRTGSCNPFLKVARKAELTSVVSGWRKVGQECKSILPHQLRLLFIQCDSD